MVTHSLFIFKQLSKGQDRTLRAVFRFEVLGAAADDMLFE
jgi:hypothetical protein